MVDTPYKLYLIDLVRLLQEEAQQAKIKRDVSVGKERDFHVGRLMALHVVISLMREQATAFGLNLNELGLDGLVPEVDLL